MKITRLNKIRGHRVFSSFLWPTDLHEFGQFNLIYGWNGAGKTTLSNLFRAIEKRKDITEGEVEFHVDGNFCPGNSLSTNAALPIVRVFNRDYVEANFFASHSSLTPIFFLGEDSIEKQKKVEALKTELTAKNTEIGKKQSAQATAEAALESFCIQQAKTVKDLLSSSPSNSYNNYNKSNFRQVCSSALKVEATPKILDEDEKAKLKQQKDGKPKDRLEKATFSFPDKQVLEGGVQALLRKKVTSEVIESLGKKEALGNWVQQGLAHHTGENESAICHFCGQSLPEKRLAELEAHFNDEYNSFLNEVDIAVESIQGKKRALEDLAFPVKDQLYDHISTRFACAASDFGIIRSQLLDYFSTLEDVLSKKKLKPFESMELQPHIANKVVPSISDADAALKKINDSIDQHNEETDNFQSVVITARKALEAGIVAEAVADFKAKQEEINTITRALTALRTDVANLIGQIAVLEREILEHLRPAEELNRELRSYLGREELKFEVKDSGYKITRNGFPAQDLSEGERTAIAFLYFLKTLQDKGFDLKKDIVVIDDPVSSLDANALFCAFGYMQERTGGAMQMFVLTHNFGFFRQVKNWFNHLPHQNKKDIALRPARFYMIEAEGTGTGRNSSLKPLDPLLHQFERVWC